MEVATRMVANLLERKVIMLAANGSMAALASWNRAMQPAKIRSGRISNRLSRPAMRVRYARVSRRRHAPSSDRFRAFVFERGRTAPARSCSRRG